MRFHQRRVQSESPMQLRNAIGAASLWASTLLVLASCGDSTGIPQSSVIMVQAPEGAIATQHDSLAPISSGMTPRMTAEAVRQALLASAMAKGLYLDDVSKLTVKLGLYTNPDLNGTANVLVYVFSGGSGDCGAPNGAAVSTTSTATPTPAQNPCTSTVIADANTGSALEASTTGGGDVQQSPASQTP